MSRSSCSEPGKNIRLLPHGSSPTTVPSLSPRTLRSLSVWPALPMSRPLPITRRVMVKSSDGTKASKADCIRPGCPLCEQDAARLIERFVNHYNAVRLHSAIGYVTPADRLAGRHLQIFSERDRKLELARQNRQTKRQSLTKSIIASTS